MASHTHCSGCGNTWCPLDMKPHLARTQPKSKTKHRCVQPPTSTSPSKPVQTPPDNPKALMPSRCTTKEEAMVPHTHCGGPKTKSGHAQPPMTPAPDHLQSM
ncbi:hypothetical protein BS47DRAFT_1357643 [Hydnum rufescens UP504]|uniref:Uncharacterized protein n=1 Tax=Hydnum rufescens UP504 TaxID=1448309 RepID=A0A9P6BAX2_9AGAM|nr:hypothetical protein BS47DRAFT_1357643 [Hydnum rufescens UP504]